MQRLVYSPSVKVFIRSARTGKTIDISEDVVSGSVTRNDQGTSSATVRFRNRYKRYTSQDGSPVFLPMDTITIFMQRIAGKPIQVFTGYLDDAPYFQMYPGDCEVNATCTLKRLAFQWFDPGLSFFRNFLQKNGWTGNPESGATFNYGQFAEDNPSLKKQDSGFGQLLYEFMTQIANWDPNQVLVSNLPVDFVDKAVEMIAKQTQLGTDDDFENYKEIMRILATVEAVPAELAPSEDEQSPTSSIQSIVTAIKDGASETNIPPIALTYAGLLLSNLDPSKNRWENNEGFLSKVDILRGRQIFGVGIFAIRPDIQSTDDPSTVVVRGTEYKKSSLLDVRKAIKIVHDRIYAPNAEANKTHIEGARKGELESVHNVAINLIAGREIDVPAADRQRLFDFAQQLLGADNAVLGQITGQDVQDIGPRPRITKDSPELLDMLSTAEKRSLNGIYTPGNGVNNLKEANSAATLIYAMKKFFPKANATVYRSQVSSEVTVLFTTFQAKTDKKYSDFLKALRTTPVLHASHRPISGPVLGVYEGRLVEEDVLKEERVPIAAKGQLSVTFAGDTELDFTQLRLGNPLAVFSDVAEDDLGDSDSTVEEVPGTGGLSLSGLARISANSAFALDFAFPVNLIESMTLTGERALMNDMSCLDAVEQFCSASLRQYMSLPDGRFCAYYPDYFGANGRKPYWEIRDIEIIDMKIQISDRSLATHVYTPGSTLSPVSGSEGIWDQILTMGVATIYMPKILESFIVPGLTGDGDFDPDAFISQFGTRILRQDMPLIKNPYFEFLMAWSKFARMWAETFATEVSFTFQPEIMAGGLIGFPEHNLQMYVKSVTHNWDYESGFTTSADLMAPAVYGSKNETKQYPGMVMAGQITSVGGN